MKKYILQIIKENEALLDGGTVTDDDLDNFARHIGYCQHERLIHLIVTCTFALLTVISMLIFILNVSLPTTLLFIFILGLTIPYIGHYYMLENKTQYMYRLYDKMRDAQRKSV